MMKAQLTYGRKSSNGEQTYEACVEVEVSDTTGGIRHAVATIWNELRKSVDDEMGAVSQSTPIRMIQANSNDEAPAQPASAAHDALATQKQINYLLLRARQSLGFDDQETKQWVLREQGVGLNKLTKRQAGALIERLQNKAG